MYRAKEMRNVLLTSMDVRKTAPKVKEVTDLIHTHFGGVLGFLRAWMVDDASAIQRGRFMNVGAREIIELWLPLTTRRC